MQILILLVPDKLTSESDLYSCLNGFAQIYYLFKGEGVELTLASPAGGWPWPGLSTRNPEATGSFTRFAHDSAAREEFADTLDFGQICIEDFEGAYCIGLPGPIWRSVREASVEAVIAQFLSLGKPVAVVPSNLDLSPNGAGKGLLIAGEAEGSAILAARTLIAAIQSKVAI